MRQQKYRYYFQHEETGNIVSKDYELEEIESYDGVQIPHRYFIFQRCQFVGLLDKNSVEIYDGDIVRWGLGFTGEWDKESWHRYAKVELFPSLQFKIIYYVNSKTLEKKPTDNYTFEFGRFAYQDTEKYLEVIGNIYENQELLVSN